MTREQILLLLFAALMSVAPYGFLPLRRRAFAVADVATWVALGGALASAAALGVHLAPSLLLAIMMAAKLAHLFLWCALVPADQVRWSPRIAAAFALAIFLIAGTEGLAWPVDGDEPYYVLMAESILHDRDLDLTNQYASLERSATRRLDLAPQLGDPVGAQGELYSRHEPLLPLLLVPGVAAFGLWGAMATIALLAALAVGSILALAEEQGVSRAAALRVWPLVAFAPPFLFYAVRIWPEAPAALCLGEAIRAAGKRKYARLAIWLLALSLLQLRFMAIAAVFALAIIIFERRTRKLALATAAIIAIPLLAAWFLVGNPLQMHSLSELAPAPLWKYARGGFGLLFDAQAGMLLQAPVWYAALVAAFVAALTKAFSVLRSPFSGANAVPSAQDEPLPRRTENGERRTNHFAIRAAAIAAVPYLILLLPREEWHGGWSPPLRYVVVFAPLIAVSAGRLLERSRAWLAPVAIWTALVAIHGAAFPWRLFHIASGESVLGAWLSVRFGSDFSRLLPSFIRPNGAAWAASILFVVAVGVAWGAAARSAALRQPARYLPDLRGWSILAAAAITLFFAAGLRPGSIVQFEDAHVDHREGFLDPELWTVARFRFTGGWRLGEGESLRFRMRPGRATLHLRAEHGGAFEIDGRPQTVPPTGAGFIEVPVEVEHERSTIHVLRGAMTFDRIESVASGK